MASCHSYARELQALQARTTSRQATYAAEAALNPLVDDYEHRFRISPLRPFSPFKIYLLAIVALDALSPTLRPSFLTMPPLSSITYFTGPPELMIAFE
jgi:hypothetical protein